MMREAITPWLVGAVVGAASLGPLGCGDDDDDGGARAGQGGSGPGGAGGAGAAGAAGGGAGGASRWSPAPDIGSGPLQETATVALGGRIYVIGGLSSELLSSAKVWVYDVAARGWSTGPDLPRQVHHANAVVVGESIYVLGALEGAAFVPVGDVWSYDPAGGGGWVARAAMPAGAERGASVAGAVGQTVYVAGGLRGAAVADVSAYDAAADAWGAPPPPLPEPRDHGCGAVIGGKFYVAGGRQGGIASPSPTLFEYAPGGAWAAKAPMPTGRAGTGCGVIDGRLYVVGGEGNAASPAGVFPQNEAYDPAADRWQSLEPMPTPRHGMGAAAWDGALYVPGGATVQALGPAATHEVFRP